MQVYRHGFRNAIAYKPFPEHEVWGADIAVIREERDDMIRDWLDGSPELVIQVKSRSNTKSELHDKAMTALAGEGAVEFWTVDPETRTVTVYNSKTGMRVYAGGTAVPVPVASDREVTVF